jgi:hypothetical protein
MTMTSVRTWSAIMAVPAILLTAAFASSGAEAQANCDWYAKTALKQQQENEQRKCNLSGPEWSSDLKSHMAWCGSVAPDVWKKAAQKRDQDLASCAAGKKP